MEGAGHRYTANTGYQPYSGEEVKDKVLMLVVPGSPCRRKSSELTIFVKTVSTYMFPKAGYYNLQQQRLCACGRYVHIRR